MVSVRRGREGTVSQNKQQNDPEEADEKGKMPEGFEESTWTNTKTDTYTEGRGNEDTQCTTGAT